MHESDPRRKRGAKEKPLGDKVKPIYESPRLLYTDKNPADTRSRVEARAFGGLWGKEENMKVLGSEGCREVRNWMYRNARPLELALWRRKFEGGGASAVIEALSAYANPDGGYGNALEPDLWTPESTPYATLQAGRIAETAGVHDPAHPVLRGICSYFLKGSLFEDDMWLFTGPSSSEYPHAPWWTYSEETNKGESLGLTAEIAAFLLRISPEKSESFAFGRRVAKRTFERFQISDSGEMSVSGICALTAALEARRVRDIVSLETWTAVCKERVAATIERDVSKWETHCPKPSRYIESPESPFYAGNEDIVRRELEYLIDTRPRGGVWGLDWSWFDLIEKYPREWAISENWWRAWTAIENVSFLSRFGRLE